ncbi:hypothetical protein ACJX0J_017903, partial [Zea mays]
LDHNIKSIHWGGGSLHETLNITGGDTRLQMFDLGVFLHGSQEKTLLLANANIVTLDTSCRRQRCAVNFGVREKPTLG